MFIVMFGQMTSAQFAIMLIAAAVVLMLVFPAIAIGMRYRKLRRQPEESPAPVCTEVVSYATVEEIACRVRTYGHKLPKTMQEFAVAFRLENGEELKLDIPEEMYHGLEKGQRGVLTVKDGELYSFELE